MIRFAWAWWLWFSLPKIESWDLQFQTQKNGTYRAWRTETTDGVKQRLKSHCFFLWTWVSHICTTLYRNSLTKLPTTSTSINGNKENLGPIMEPTGCGSFKKKKPLQLQTNGGSTACSKPLKPFLCSTESTSPTRPLEPPQGRIIEHFGSLHMVPKGVIYHWVLYT